MKINARDTSLRPVPLPTIANRTSTYTLVNTCGRLYTTEHTQRQSDGQTQTQTQAHTHNQKQPQPQR